MRSRSAGGMRIASPVGADLVDLVEHEYRVVGLGAPDRLDDAAWHGADVGAAVAADLGLVVHSAERGARELAPHRAGDRVPQRRLAHAGRADEAEDGLASAFGGAAVLAQLPHREVLDDALLHLVEVVVVVVEDRASLRHVDLAACGRVPRQRDHQVEVGSDDRRLRRRAGDALEARDLALGLALGLGGKSGLGDPLAKLGQLGLVAIELAQLALDGLQLLAQEVLALMWLAM
ncbi:MAG: hypothetical protein AUI15_08465 [Actinobacteria bacterium 13_2_20CM_2_66_6]|nr:MAG: hypothetical protein AUI15_08465 [Actinobacteria bacterium 13_2_20CM_2_66_6]